MKIIPFEEQIKTSFDLARKCIQENKHHEAELILNQILVVDPENQDVKKFLAVVYYKTCFYEKALEILEKLTENDDVYNYMSMCYMGMKQFDKAIELSEKAIKINPKNHTYYNNLGLQYKEINEFKKSHEQFDKAELLAPNDIYVYVNRSLVYSKQKRLDKTEEYLLKALSIENNAEIKVNLAYVYFLQEKYERGWEYYESRMDYFPQVAQFRAMYDPKKSWNGKDQGNLVVYCEQGAGDFIHFYRFLPLVKNKVFLHTPKELHSLFEYNSHGQLIKEKFDEYDWHCSIMSLPYLLNVKKWDTNAYLNAPKILDFSTYQDKFKIGIVWAGNPIHPNDYYRSCELKHFKKIQQISDKIKLFCLQKDLRNRAYSFHKSPINLTEDTEDMKIVNMSDHLTDFMNTASIIKEMDLVITVDTSVLHLASALGVPTYGLISFEPDWRWGLSGVGNNWYKNLKLFRQSKHHQWEDVFDNVVKMIKNENNL